MSRPWWRRIFRPAEQDRHTDRILREVREALRKLDRALLTVDQLPERRRHER